MSHRVWTVRFPVNPADLLSYLSADGTEVSAPVTLLTEDMIDAAPSKFFDADGNLDGEVAVNIVLEVAGAVIAVGGASEDDMMRLVEATRERLNVPRVRDLSMELAPMLSPVR